MYLGLRKQILNRRRRRPAARWPSSADGRCTRQGSSWNGLSPINCEDFRRSPPLYCINNMIASRSKIFFFQILTLHIIIIITIVKRVRKLRQIGSKIAIIIIHKNGQIRTRFLLINYIKLAKTIFIFYVEQWWAKRSIHGVNHSFCVHKIYS